ncbi:MAG TPA: hypothetical protein VFU94_09440 [Conexibacter sp.]|nr:hypothetical protein [Conexibacter sp.]
MTLVHVRDGAELYGARVGILHLPCRIPFAPGGVGHAATYRYPVVMRTIDCADMASPEFEARAVEAACWLEAQGVVAVTSDCGTLIRHQRAVAEAISVPVILSPLLQLPLVIGAVGGPERVGIVAAVAENVDAEQLRLAGVAGADAGRIAIAGMQDQPAFRAAVLEEQGTLDTEAVGREAADVARRLVAEHPRIRALVLDCSDLPPYAEAIRRATGRPVFDFVTMIDHAERAARGVG